MDEFVYLGAYIDKEGGSSRDIRNRLQKAQSAFQRLRKVWSARGIGRRTKIRLFKTLTRLTNLKLERSQKTDEKKLENFQY